MNDMSTEDPIGRDLIDAYRDGSAPEGFAARVAYAARGRRRPRSRELLWAIPAAAAVILAVVLWQGGERDVPASPRLALSIAGMPAGLPTMSNLKSQSLPTVAALAPIPTTPTLDLTLPVLRPSNRASTKTDLPN